MRFPLITYLVAALASSATAQEPPTLDPAGVRGVRYVMRDEARMVATNTSVDTLMNWYAVGVVRPTALVTPAEIRTAFEGNTIQAERRFAQPFIISGALHSVSRRADRQIVVQFVEGGFADSQRRAMAVLGARGNQLDPAQVLGGLTGGRMHAGATAVLSAEHEDTAAGWDPGATVTLHCRGASNVPLAVLLDNCVPRAAVIAAADRLADAQSDLVLARQPLTVPPTDERDTQISPDRRSMGFLVVAYAYGLMARDCPVDHLASWTACLTAILNRTKAVAQDAMLQQAKRDLVISDQEFPPLSALPPLAPPPPQRARGAPRK